MPRSEWPDGMFCREVGTPIQKIRANTSPRITRVDVISAAPATPAKLSSYPTPKGMDGIRGRVTGMAPAGSDNSTLPPLERTYEPRSSNFGFVFGFRNLNF